MRSLLVDGDWSIVAGEFDPLTAAAADFIQQQASPGKKLMVCLLPSPAPLLTGHSRAVLIAGMRSVDAVVLAENECWQSQLPAGSVPVFETDPERRRNEFEALVLAKQGTDPK